MLGCAAAYTASIAACAACFAAPVAEPLLITACIAAAGTDVDACADCGI